MKKTLKFIDNSLALVENSLIVLIVAIMVVMSFLQVLLRNFFDYGILWGDIFLRHMVLWVGFIGASLATRDEKHINIDVLGRISPEKFRPYLRTVVDLFTMLVCIALAHAAYGFLQYEIEANTILFNDIPAWIFQIIIPLGFALIAFRFLLKILERISGAASAEPRIKQT